MTKTTFQIQDTEGCIELTASGDLTVSIENTFRWILLKLLMHGKAKSFKLNLTQVGNMDYSCIQLIHILDRQLAAVNASLEIIMPEGSRVKAFQLNAEFPKSLFQRI